MPDLSMPQRQTYPGIRGRVADQVGALPLDDADEIVLLLEVDAESDLFELPAAVLDPEDPGSIFLDSAGNEVAANFEAPIGASGVSTATATLRGKLMIIWDAGATPPLVQYAPQQGFIEVVITENVQAPA